MSKLRLLSLFFLRLVSTADCAELTNAGALANNAGYQAAQSLERNTTDQENYASLASILQKEARRKNKKGALDEIELADLQKKNDADLQAAIDIVCNLKDSSDFHPNPGLPDDVIGIINEYLVSLAAKHYKHKLDMIMRFRDANNNFVITKEPGVITLYKDGDEPNKTHITAFVHGQEAIGMDANDRPVFIGKNLKTLYVWDLQANRRRHRLVQSSHIDSLAIGDKKSGSFCMIGLQNGSIRIIDPVRGTVIKTIQIGTTPISSVACGRGFGKQIIAAGSEDGHVTLLDAQENNYLLYHSPAHAQKEAVTNIKMVNRRNGNDLIATSSRDKTVKIWDFGGDILHRPKHIIRFDSPVTVMDFKQIDEKDVILAAGTENGILEIWLLSEKEPLKIGQDLFEDDISKPIRSIFIDTDNQKLRVIVCTNSFHQVWEYMPEEFEKEVTDQKNLQEGMYLLSVLPKPLQQVVLDYVESDRGNCVIQ